MKKWKKPLIGVGVFVAIVLLIIIFRIPILRATGNFLVKENPLEKVEAMFVLSGGPLDRGNEAAKVYKAGYATKVICTGENIPPDFEALGLTFVESEITRKYMLTKGIADSSIELIKKGTSTREEQQVILEYCKQKGLKKVMILSSKFHTRRISRTFGKPFKNAGIELIIHGAPSSSYDEETWWQKENGLISLNNEYIKLVYYWWKY